MTNIKSKIPKIRFKEFEWEWEEKKLWEIFQINAWWDIDNNHVSNIKTNVFKYPIFANAEKNKWFYWYSDIYKIDEGILTVAWRGVNLWIAHARNEKFYPIVRLLTLKPKIKSDVHFFEYQINNLNFFIESTWVPQLTWPQISIYKTFFPSLPEQQKIALFLSNVDEKIEKIKEKKKSLEEYKKWVMQKIFGVGNENIRSLRFKDENWEEFGEWEEKKLGEICKLQWWFSFKSTEFKKSWIPIIRISNISNNNNYIDLSNIIYYNEIKNDENYIIQNWDLIIAMSWATTWKSSIYNLKEKAYLNQRVWSFKANLNKLNYWFLIQFVFSDLFYKQLDWVLVAGAQPNISWKDIENFILNLPTLKEQQKIADFLSWIDEKIEKVGEELGKMEEFKRGLLQGIFV